MSPLRGHAFYLELAGRRGPAWWPWLVGAAVLVAGVVEAVSCAAR